MKRGGAESSELVEALEELDVVEQVAALVDIAAKGRGAIRKGHATQGWVWQRAANQFDQRHVDGGGGCVGRES